MKKINFNLFNRLFNRRRSPLPPSNYAPLFHPLFSAGFFDHSSTPNQLILTKNIDKKHYQVKLMTRFIKSGSHCAGLLLKQIGKIGQLASGFPQITNQPTKTTLSNYISNPRLPAESPLLKKPVKITSQSGSNNINSFSDYRKSAKNHLVPAETIPQIQSDKTNNDGNYCQRINHLLSPFENQIHNNQHCSSNDSRKKNSDQRNVAPVINKLTNKNVINSTSDFGLVNTGEMIPAVNQAAATVLEKSESALSWTELNPFINLVYHNQCN